MDAYLERAAELHGDGKEYGLEHCGPPYIATACSRVTSSSFADHHQSAARVSTIATMAPVRRATPRIAIGPTVRSRLTMPFSEHRQQYRPRTAERAATAHSVGTSRSCFRAAPSLLVVVDERLPPREYDVARVVALLRGELEQDGQDDRMP